MKRARIGLVGAAVLAVATLAWAQAKPDFSGMWTPEPAAEGTGGGGRGMAAGPMTVKQTGDTLTIERTGRGGNTMTQTYKLDGSETDIMMGQMGAKASAKWDGDKLVIITKSERGEQTQTWSLADGMLTIERTGVRGGTSKTVYKKGA